MKISTRLVHTVFALGIWSFLAGGFWPGQVMAQCTWSSGPNSSHQQVEGINVVLNNKLYIFYGFVNGTQITNTVEVFDPNAGGNGQWTSLAQMIVPVTHVDAVVVEGEIWLVGGFKGNHGGPPTDTIQIYNPSSNNWRVGPTLPTPHASGVSVLLGRKIHVISGLMPDRTTGNPKHYVYDLDKTWLGWDTLAPHPLPRNHVGGFSMMGRIYVLGGQTSHDGPTPTVDKDLVDVYDPYTDSWQYISPLNVPRSHIEPGTFAMDGKIYVTGGNTTLGLRNDIISYDVETGAIGFLCTTPTFLFSPAAKVIGNKYYIAHGGQYGYTNPLDKIWSTTITPVKRLELGVWPKTMNLNVNTGSATPISKEGIIYTVSDQTGFSLNEWAKPSWITSISKSGVTTSPTGTELNLNINPSGLANGTYTFDLIIAAFGYTSDTMTISLNVSGPSLPVILSKFEANRAGNGYALLNWTTQSEVNHDYFEIERRFEHEDEFHSVGKVSGKGQEGNETGYNFTDRLSPMQSGKIHYRLKMVDIDGAYTHSEVKTIAPAVSNNQYRVYPIPTSGLLQVEIQAPGSQRSRIHLYDLSGRQVIAPIDQQDETGLFYYQIETKEIPSGYYLLEMETETGSHTQKVIIQ